jgi:hypothetical protein
MLTENRDFLALFHANLTLALFFAMRTFHTANRARLELPGMTTHGTSTAIFASTLAFSMLTEGITPTVFALFFEAPMWTFVA